MASQSVDLSEITLAGDENDAHVPSTLSSLTETRDLGKSEFPRNSIPTPKPCLNKFRGDVEQTQESWKRGNFLSRVLQASKHIRVTLCVTILLSIVLLTFGLILGILIGKFAISNGQDDQPCHLKNTPCVSSSSRTDSTSCACSVSQSSSVMTFTDSFSPITVFSEAIETAGDNILSTSWAKDSYDSYSSEMNLITSTKTADIENTNTVGYSLCPSPVTVTTTMLPAVSPTPVTCTETELLSPSVTSEQHVSSLSNDSGLLASSNYTVMPTPTPSNDSGDPPSTSTRPSFSSEPCSDCPSRDPVIDVNGTELSPFSPLSEEETANVVSLIKERGYASYTQYFHENRISHVYLYRASKAAILDYLDNNGSLPSRYARVQIIRPTASPPDVMEYKVGPLNVKKENMHVEQLLQDGTISINRKPVDAEETRELYDFIGSQVETLNNLLSESFDNITYRNGAFVLFTLVPTDDMTDRVSHMVMGIDVGEYSTLALLPVSCLVHHPGFNTSTWYTSDWYYVSQGPFNSSQELQEAYNSGALRKVAFPEGYRAKHKGELNPIRNASLPLRAFADIPPPRTYEPKGSRYSVEGQKVSWMGWEFEFSSDPLRGPALFNIKLFNKRIAYEISLQDVTLIYHSQTNGHGPLVLSDMNHLLGTFTKPRHGLDCPPRATVLKTSNSIYGYAYIMDAACVFEADGQKPLWRHWTRGLADHYLVVRAVMTVGNYDYTMEWHFHLDGKIETLLTASGYLYGAFWEADDPFPSNESSSTPFGYRILDYVSGPIHDHTYSFKVDLDILGANNSFQNIKWKAGQSWKAFKKYVNSTTKPEFFYFNTTRYIENEITETESRFTLDPTQPTYFTVINENESNMWGVKRGYRLIPHSKFGEILQEHPMLSAWDHLRYHLAVSRQKDTEQYVADSAYRLSHPTSYLPSINSVVLDDEPVRDDDLVLWVTEKFYHIPSSEDVPVTLSVQSGFTLKPFNYFDRTPVFDMPAHYSETVDPYAFEKCYENTDPK